MRTISTLTVGFLLLLTGCPGDDSGTTGASAGSTGSTGGTSTTSPATTEVDTTEGPATTAMTGSTTNSTTPGSTTDEPGSTTDEPGTTSGESSGDTGSPEICNPDPADDACAMCVKDMCCDELDGCNNDPSGGCQCFQECIQEMGGAAAFTCQNMCMVNFMDPMSPTGQLAGCTQQNCGFGICI